MLDFLTHFDGSGRQPRPVQSAALEWSSAGWHMSQVDAISGPVGCGKSAIARAIQLTTGAVVVTPSNILIDQYARSYPRVNFLKGKKHYRCHFSGLSCSDWIDGQEQPPCDRCPYQAARLKAKSGVPTFFNPLSLYHCRLERQKTIIVDEAHQLGSVLTQLASKRFPRSVYGFTDRCQFEVYLSQWLKEQLEKLNRLLHLYTKTDAPKERLRKIADEIESIGVVKECLDADAGNTAIYIDRGTYHGKPETFLNVRPVSVPKPLVRKLLNCDKLVLLSGTLLKTDIEDLAAGKPYRYLDLPSPIPKERRPILYRPMPFAVNKDTCPRRMAHEIEKVLAEFGGRNAIIHTSYDRSAKMAPHFKTPVMVNTPETKAYTLDQFTKFGGVWLAAGCSEGLDLKGDVCRLNVIPHLLRPNLGDPVVKKWRAQAGGERRYALETIKTSVQQYGRSTRDPEDESITVVMDPGFAGICQKYGPDIPKYFTEAIQWRRT